jgi:hypothetical protein
MAASASASKSPSASSSPSPEMPVGTVVITRTRLQKNLEAIRIDWTADSSGGVSGNSFAIGAGVLWQAEFIPGKYNARPADQYDVVVNDAHGADVVVGKGANLSNLTALLGVQDAPLSWLAGGTLDVVVANAGAAKTGSVILTVERV